MRGGDGGGGGVCVCVCVCARGGGGGFIFSQRNTNSVCRVVTFEYLYSYHTLYWEQITWCFMPSQPVRLYQGDLCWEPKDMDINISISSVSTECL